MSGRLTVSARIAASGGVASGAQAAWIDHVSLAVAVATLDERDRWIAASHNLIAQAEAAQVTDPDGADVHLQARNALRTLLHVMGETP